MAPLTKRKLNTDHHVVLMDLAIARFIDHDARQAEADALKALGQSIYDDWKAEYEPNLPVLGRFLSVSSLENLVLHRYEVVTKEERSFTHGTGQVVNRPARWESKGMAMPLLGVRSKRHLSEMRAEGYIAGRCTFPSNWSERAPLNDHIEKEKRMESVGQYFDVPNLLSAQHIVPLPAPIKIVNGVSYTVLYPTKERAAQDRMGHGGWMTPWISARTYAAYRKLGETIDARVKNEAKMLQTIDLLIREAGTYENLLKTWPEAADVEEKLFGPKSTNKMLTVVTPEAAGLICKNMQSRGVKSSICEIPAVVTATAAATGNMAAAISA